MFRNLINFTPMTTDIANDYFSNIYGSSWNGDYTFVSTLRALVAPRMDKDDELSVSFGSIRYDQQTLSSCAGESIIREMYDPDYHPNGEIRIINVCCLAKEDSDTVFSIIRNNFLKRYSHWSCLEKISDFFRKAFAVLCYANPETRQVLLVVCDLDATKLHYLQCSILAFLPWYFDPEDGISTEEMELIQSLRDKSSERYMESLARIAQKYDFRTAKIKKYLAGFETRYEQQERRRCVELIAQYRASIEDYNRRISTALQNIRDYNIRITGIDTRISDAADSEIMDYFMSNNRLSLSYVDADAMVFVVSDFASYFDSDMAKDVIDRDNSYFYSNTGRFTRDEIKMLMTALFVEQSIKLKFCAAYRFRLGISVEGMQSYDFSSECADSMANPHINDYGCLGSYRTVINEMVADNNYIGAIEQCMASCKSLNFADGIVMGTFMRKITSSQYSKRIIQLPNGAMVTPADAVQWLKEEQKGTDTNE